MSFFKNIFKKDPQKELDRAVDMIARGELERALKIAMKVEAAGGETADRAHDLAASARSTLVEDLVRNADRSEAACSLLDAADWLQAACEYEVDEAALKANRIRMADLRERASNAPKKETEVYDEAPTAEDEEVTLADDDYFNTLVATMREDIADRYHQADERFQKAFLKLNQNRWSDADAELQALLKENPNQPLYQLEAARCALFLNRPEDARVHTEAIWEHFGDEPLDLAGVLSIPGLWGEAMLRLENAAAVAERLGPISGIERGNAHMTMLYASALELSKQLEKAVEVLAPARKAFPGDPWFPFHLARTLDELEDWEEAIECLEVAIAPSCAGGSCNAPRKHVPSIRYLIALYLGHQKNVDRVGVLLGHLEDALQGKFHSEDFRLIAAFHRQQGEETAAAEAEAAAERLMA